MDEEKKKWTDEDGWDWYCLTSPTVVRKFCGQQLHKGMRYPIAIGVTTKLAQDHIP